MKNIHSLQCKTRGKTDDEREDSNLERHAVELDCEGTEAPEKQSKFSCVKPKPLTRYLLEIFQTDFCTANRSKYVF